MVVKCPPFGNQILSLVQIHKIPHQLDDIMKIQWGGINTYFPLISPHNVGSLFVCLFACLLACLLV